SALAGSLTLVLARAVGVTATPAGWVARAGAVTVASGLATGRGENAQARPAAARRLTATMRGGGEYGRIPLPISTNGADAPRYLSGAANCLWRAAWLTPQRAFSLVR